MNYEPQPIFPLVRAHLGSVGPWESFTWSGIYDPA